MATAVANRVKETTTTSGTGAVTLLGAAVGYQTFLAAIGNGNACYYCIADQAGTNWEIGVGTYTSSTNTLSRTTVLASSNSNSLVSFGSNTKDVFVTAPSGSMVMQDSATGAAKMPVGTTAQRPGTPESGMYRLNSESGVPEWYDSIGSRWLPFFDSRVIYEIEVLLVAGGGGSAGGGSEPAGGGGAGGMITSTYRVENGANLSIVVGNGGAGVSGNNAASSGSNSTISYAGNTLFTAVGGGSGGNGSGGTGAAGGSGGGGSGWNGGPGGSGTNGQGSNGGAGANLGSGGGYASGGGGGKTAAGVAAASNKGGDGGAGGLWGGSYYAGGGGGSTLYSGTTGSGGIGGGGSGSSSAINSSGTSGTANTGGGGGAANGTGTGGSGGKGVCVIRYVGSQRGSGGTVTTSGGYTYHTFTNSGTYTG